MSEPVYQAIYERARENLEKSGGGNPYDILGPDLPGTETALMGYERFGLKMRLMLTDAADTKFDFHGQEAEKPRHDRFDEREHPGGPLGGWIFASRRGRCALTVRNTG